MYIFIHLFHPDLDGNVKNIGRFYTEKRFICQFHYPGHISSLEEAMALLNASMSLMEK